MHILTRYLRVECTQKCKRARFAADLALARGSTVVQAAPSGMVHSALSRPHFSRRKMHFSAMGRTDDLDEVKGQPQSALDVERSITTRSMTHSSAPYSQAGARSACHRVCGDEKTLCEEGRVSVSNPPYTRNILTGRARTAVVSV